MAAAIPIIAAVISSAGAVYAAKASKPDMPEGAQLQGEQPAAIQTVDTGDKQKEAELLANKQKRQKQGFLESFGASVEDNTKYGLL
jgi:hypothetical protein